MSIASILRLGTRAARSTTKVASSAARTAAKTASSSAQRLSSATAALRSQTAQRVARSTPANTRALQARAAAPVVRTVSRQPTVRNTTRTPVAAQRAAVTTRSSTVARPIVTARATPTSATSVRGSSTRARRGVTATTPVSQAATGTESKSSIWRKIADNPLASAVLGTGVTVGGFAAYDYAVTRNTVPEPVADAIAQDSTGAIMDALNALMEAQVAQDGQLLAEDGSPLLYNGEPLYMDPLTGTMEIPGTDYSLSPGYADTGVDWIDEAVNEEGAVIVYDEDGNPVALLYPDGTMVGLYESESDAVKKANSINWMLWIGIAAVLGGGIYYVWRHRRTMKTRYMNRSSRRMMLV